MWKVTGCQASAYWTKFTLLTPCANQEIGVSLYGAAMVCIPMSSIPSFIIIVCSLDVQIKSDTKQAIQGQTEAC